MTNPSELIDLGMGDAVHEDALKDLIRAAVGRNLAKPRPGHGT